MPSQPEPPTVADVVRRAVAACDPHSEDALLGDFEARFEDADEPVTAVVDLDNRLANAAADLDPELDDAALSMAVVTALYLAYRRDEIVDDPDEVLRLAARAEWKGDTPENVRAWLAERSIGL